MLRDSRVLLPAVGVMLLLAAFASIARDQALAQSLQCRRLVGVVVVVGVCYCW